jgi:hypothetical protein
VETDLIEDKTNVNYQTEVTWRQTTGLYTKTNHTILKGIKWNMKWLEC